MDLKKRKDLTSKKEDNFFLFSFSFQSRKDLALVKFYIAGIRCFLTNGYVEYIPCTNKTGKFFCL